LKTSSVECASQLQLISFMIQESDWTVITGPVIEHVRKQWRQRDDTPTLCYWQSKQKWAFAIL